MSESVEQYKKDISEIAKALSVTGKDGQVGGFEIGTDGLNMDGADGKYYSFFEIMKKHIELMKENVR